MSAHGIVSCPGSKSLFIYYCERGKKHSFQLQELKDEKFSDRKIRRNIKCDCAGKQCFSIIHIHALFLYRLGPF